MDKPEKALNWLEHAYDHKDGSMVFLKVIPLFDKLRSEKRFNNILRNMGLIN
jgi:hypothetical protein